MSKLARPRIICDGPECSKTIDDNHRFLWYHVNEDLDYCPECWREKRKDLDEENRMYNL